MKRIEKYNLDYDNELMKINHYTNHPQMLPYIGEKYEKNKILFVSESHYVPSGYKNQISSDDWYESPSLNTIESMQGNTNTRGVIDNYFNKKGHRLFINIHSALVNADSNLSLRNVAWYNFYQRPANHKTEFKNANEKDVEKAFEVFEGVINILKPELIVFLSKNAFGCLQKGPNKESDRKWNSEIDGHQFKDYKIPIMAASHPNSPWWNRKHGVNKETGKQRFEQIIRKRI